MSQKLPPTKEGSRGSVPDENVPLQSAGAGPLLASGQVDGPSTLHGPLDLGGFAETCLGSDKDPVWASKPHELELRRPSPSRTEPEHEDARTGSKTDRTAEKTRGCEVIRRRTDSHAEEKERGAY